MEYNAVRLIVSVSMIILGTFYFLNPIKAISIINFNRKEEPNKSTIYRFKYGGILIALLGIYYILVMFDIVPMFKY